MQLTPYLAFNGQCAAAFKFYEKVLDGKMVTLMTYGESSMAEQVPTAWHTRVIHASLLVDGNAWLMGADAPPDRENKTTGFCVNIGIEDPEKAERIFNAMAEGGTVQMPLQQTFWTVRFGMLTDQFGIPWMVNCEQAPGEPAGSGSGQD